MTAYTIDFNSIIALTNEQFEQLWQVNPDIQI